MSTTTKYLANPDVSCREEDPDEGALLFNPDKDSVIVINSVGLLIWRALGQPHSQAEIVASLEENCDNVPIDQVANDVDAFLKSLVPGGFIGEVVES